LLGESINADFILVDEKSARGAAVDRRGGYSGATIACGCVLQAKLAGNRGYLGVPFSTVMDACRDEERWIWRSSARNPVDIKD
jgi:hypothetical protein